MATGFVCLFLALASLPAALATCNASRQVHCPSLQRPRNGDIYFTNMAQYQSVAFYRCDTGWHLVNQSVGHRSCQCNGTWSGSENNCTANVCKEPILKPANGGVLEGAIAPYSVRRFQCDPDHVMRGAMTTICLPSGQWHGIPPVCEKAIGCPSITAEPWFFAALGVASVMAFILAVSIVAYANISQRRPLKDQLEMLEMGAQGSASVIVENTQADEHRAAAPDGVATAGGAGSVAVNRTNRYSFVDPQRSRPAADGESPVIAEGENSATAAKNDIECYEVTQLKTQPGAMPTAGTPLAATTPATPIAPAKPIAKDMYGKPHKPPRRPSEALADALPLFPEAPQPSATGPSAMESQADPAALYAMPDKPKGRRSVSSSGAGHNDLAVADSAMRALDAVQIPAVMSDVYECMNVKEPDGDRTLDDIAATDSAIRALDELHVPACTADIYESMTVKDTADPSKTFVLGDEAADPASSSTYVPMKIGVAGGSTHQTKLQTLRRNTIKVIDRSEILPSKPVMDGTSSATVESEPKPSDASQSETQSPELKVKVSGEVQPDALASYSTVEDIMKGLEGWDLPPPEGDLKVDDTHG